MEYILVVLVVVCGVLFGLTLGELKCLIDSTDEEE